MPIVEFDFAEHLPLDESQLDRNYFLNYLRNTHFITGERCDVLK